MNVVLKPANEDHIEDKDKNKKKKNSQKKLMSVCTNNHPQKKGELNENIMDF